MLGFGKKKQNPHAPLSDEQQEDNINALKTEFDALWNDDVESLYKKLMLAMGQDFLLNKNLNNAYKQKVLSHAKSFDLTLHKNKDTDVIFKMADGYVAANYKHVTYMGAKFDAKTADEMAFLAAHDKDMQDQGLTLEGDHYQQTMLQLSILEYDPQITIHNVIQFEDLDPQAKAAFETYKNANRAQPENTTSEKFDAAANSNTVKPKAKPSKPILSEQLLGAVQDEILNQINLGDKVTRKDLESIVKSLTKEGGIKGSMARAITSTAKWLVDKGILEEIKHGDSPIINRILADTPETQKLKAKFQSSTQRGKSFRQAAAGFASEMSKMASKIFPEKPSDSPKPQNP